MSTIITTISFLLAVCNFGVCLTPNAHVIKPSGNVLHPPLVLIGGMAQTKGSWDHHLPSLSRNRQVIVYECIGQGKSNLDPSELQNVSLQMQAETLTEKVLRDLEVPVDLVGFSFGARVALATACLSPDCIRKMHLTGVASERSNYGNLAIEAWKSSVQSDPSLRLFAWSILMATYSPSFLQSQPMDRYIDHICKTNSREGLLALLKQAEVSDLDDPWHVVNMAERIKQKGISGKLCVGELDHMAPKEQAIDLCSKLGFTDTLVIPNCGHAVAIEGARAWKQDVLDFLNSEEKR